MLAVPLQREVAGGVVWSNIVSQPTDKRNERVCNAKKKTGREPGARVQKGV